MPKDTEFAVDVLADEICDDEGVLDLVLSNLAETLEEHPCVNCGKPGVWQSPTGHWGCETCRDDIAYALASIPDNTEFESKVDVELDRLRVRASAQQLLKTELRPPTVPPTILTLTERLEIEHPPQEWRIDKWQPANTRVLLAAQYKAGKTTLTGNLARSLADGARWLDHAQTTPVEEGNVTIIDFEMSERQIDSWLADQNIGNTDKVTVIPLRGRATTFDILDGTTRQEWARHLENTEYLILDCLRPILDGLGLDEHRDAGQFLTAFDTLCEQADIPDSLIVHHMGHSGERSRGDSRLRDWPDVEWRLVRADDNPASPRFMSAFGRDVDVEEGEIGYDQATRHVQYKGGNRTNSAARAAIPDILAVLVEADEPMTKTAIEKVVRNIHGHTRKIVRDGLEIAIHQGQIWTEIGLRGAHLCSLSDVSSPARRSSPQLASEVPSSSPARPIGAGEVGDENRKQNQLAASELPDPFDEPNTNW